MATSKKIQKKLDSELIEAAKDWKGNRIADIITLLDQGANVNATDKRRRTPLHFASHNNDPQTVKLLLERGANPNAFAYFGDGVSLHLLDIHDNPTETANYGTTPLYTAVDNWWKVSEEKHLLTIQLLLQNGADPNIQNELGSTPIIIASTYADKNAISLLLEYGADVTLTQISGMTTLHRLGLDAVQRHNQNVFSDIKESFDLLLKAGADLNARTTKIYPLLNGTTPFLKSFYGYYFTKGIKLIRAKLFLDAGVNPNQQDLNGNTALHYAVVDFVHNDDDYLRQVECIQFLINNGANPFIKNKSGDTPYDLTHHFILNQPYYKKITKYLRMIEDMYLKKQTAKGLRFLETITQQPNLQKEPFPELPEHIIHTLGKNYLGLTPANVEWQHGMPASLIQQLKEAKSAKESRMAATQEKLRKRLRENRLIREKEEFLEGLNDEERRAAGNVGWLGGERFRKKTQKHKKRSKKTRKH